MTAILCAAALPILAWSLAAAVSDHGYSRYTHGCRCPICKGAKAAYIRAKRKAARESAPAELINGRDRYVAPGIKHGTLSGWQEWSCRCLECSEMHRQAQRRQWPNRGGAA
jgi:hypothetical protein